MRLFILIIGLAVYLFSTGIVSMPKIFSQDLFEDKQIVLFEDLQITPENIGEENYSALRNTLAAPNNLNKIKDILK